MNDSTAARKKQAKIGPSELAHSNAKTVDSSLFETEDWTEFRSLDTLQRKAGVPRSALPKLVVKELVDNALDAGHSCEFSALDEGWVLVSDDGPGIAGDDAEIANLFSLRRPLRTSKALRRPTRGALGNGLRVVVGTVVASGGELRVSACGRTLTLRPLDSGYTDVAAVAPWPGNGTEVAVRFGPALRDGLDDVFAWANQANALARHGDEYKGRTSPWWYTSDAFRALFHAAPVNVSVLGLVAELDGCSGEKAQAIAGELKGRPARELDADEIEGILSRARGEARPVTAGRLGKLGRVALPGYAGYSLVSGAYQLTSGRGEHSAEIPFVIEVWARESEDGDGAIAMNVNRSPIVAELATGRRMKDRSLYGLAGCGLSSQSDQTATPFKVARGREYFYLVNITTPHLPLVSDSKAPNLAPVRAELVAALEKATRGVKRKAVGTSGTGEQHQNRVIEAEIDSAIEKASGGGIHRYSLRQLFYVLRPIVAERIGADLQYGWFCEVVGTIEAARESDLPGIYRDDRGSLYHPHGGGAIPLGTRLVERYERPDWTFNKILYCEKEGFFPLLRDVHWPEQNDCALLTSKGYASRAARDVIDLLGESDEEIHFYAIHDLDADGTKIFDGLQDATTARPARRVKIHDLGLTLADIEEMELEVEVPTKKERKKAVGRRVDDRTRRWLQSHRVELNAMTTPDFIEWLDRKMAEAEAPAKVIPPEPVLGAELREVARERIGALIRERILREQGYEARVADCMGRVEVPILDAKVREALDEDPVLRWSSPVADVAAELAARAVESQR